jgi:hypothetical protein
LAREARNASLGRAGEEFVSGVAHRQLWQAGEHDLANRIEHVPRTQGDGLGHDIFSYEIDGRERLVEVKIIAFSSMTPFFASQRDVTISDERSQHYNLYCVFKFRESPKLFVLPGSLRESCVLDPIQCRASLL